MERETQDAVTQGRKKGEEERREHEHCNQMWWMLLEGVCRRVEGEKNWKRSEKKWNKEAKKNEKESHKNEMI